MARTAVALNILVLLGLCWSLAVASPLPTANGRVAEVENGTKPDSDVPEHCLDTWSFDAATMDHNGTMLCSKKSFLESHTHQTQLWNATVESARVKASFSSKVTASGSGTLPQEPKRNVPGQLLGIALRP
ncbi:hemopexin, isoform CRA_a [Mus musculus]|nr:hemopexin, isoform CRA_a [Mus musculus]